MLQPQLERYPPAYYFLLRRSELKAPSSRALTPEQTYCTAGLDNPKNGAAVVMLGAGGSAMTWTLALQNESIRDFAYNDANKLVTSQPVRTGIRDHNLVEKRDNMDIYFAKARIHRRLHPKERLNRIFTTV